jgi:hypothetical protein
MDSLGRPNPHNPHAATERALWQVRPQPGNITHSRQDSSVVQQPVPQHTRGKGDGQGDIERVEAQIKVDEARLRDVEEELHRGLGLAR